MENFGMASGSQWKSFIANVNECRNRFCSSLDCDQSVKSSWFPFLQETSRPATGHKKMVKGKHPKQVIVLGSIARNQKSVVEQAISWLSQRYKTVIISKGFGCQANCLVSGEGNIADRLINARAADGQLHLNKSFDVFILPNYGKMTRQELLDLSRFKMVEVIVSAGYQIFPDIHMLAILSHGKLLP